MEVPNVISSLIIFLVFKPSWFTLLWRIPLLCEVTEIHGYATEHDRYFLKPCFSFTLATFIQGVANLLLFSFQLSKISVLRCKDETEQFSPALCLMELCWACSLQVFALQSSLFRLGPPDYVRLAMVDFLSAMGKVFIPQEAQVI